MKRLLLMILSMILLFTCVGAGAESATETPGAATLLYSHCRRRKEDEASS